METTKINDLSFYNDQSILTIPAKQYDTGRKFCFNIITDNEIFDLSECVVYLRMLKSDGSQFQGSDCCSVSGNSIIIDTSTTSGSQILSCAGINQCELHLSSKDGKCLTTWTFYIEVTPRVHDGSHINPTDSWDTWDNLEEKFYNLEFGLAAKADTDNAALTGIPKAPTAAVETITDQIATTAFVHKAIGNDVTSGDEYITCSPTERGIVITHNDISGNNSTTTASLSNGGSFTTVKSITNDSKGHVTGINTETVTLPNINSVTYSSRWSSARNINGMSIDGSVNRTNYGVCAETWDKTARTVSCPGFQLVTGAEIDVDFKKGYIDRSKFSSTTLNVNGTGAKPIKYNNYNSIPVGASVHGVHTFRYDGASWNLVGDLNTDTDTHAIYYDRYDFDDCIESGLHTLSLEDTGNDEILNAPESGFAQWGCITICSNVDSDELTQLAFKIDDDGFTYPNIYMRRRFDDSENGNGWPWGSWYAFDCRRYNLTLFANKTVYNDYSINVGRKSGTTVGSNSFACGHNVTASSSYSQGEGFNVTASAVGAHGEGFNTAATNFASHASGRYNKAMTNGDVGSTQVGDVFVIGNGTASNALSNALRVTYKGEVYGTQAFKSSGADYAEHIKEWADGNPDNEDRVGYMVTIKGGFLHKANPGDYIAGITSGNPSVVGNADEDYYWKYERDEFNRIVLEDVPETVQQTDEDGKPMFDEENHEPIMIETGKIIKNARMKLADDYDPSLQNNYIERKDRKEWDYVGMVGVIPVRDDGTCLPNHFCKCGKDGIATLADEREFDTFYVIERIAGNVVSVELR